MSRLDAIVLAAGSLGLAANLALSQPGPAQGVHSPASHPVAKDAVKVQPLSLWKTANR